MTKKKNKKFKPLNALLATLEVLYILNLAISLICFTVGYPLPFIVNILFILIGYLIIQLTIFWLEIYHNV